MSYRHSVSYSMYAEGCEGILNCAGVRYTGSGNEGSDQECMVTAEAELTVMTIVESQSSDK